MPAYDEIITVWKQQGAANFRRELGLVARDAGVTERALAKLGLQMDALGRRKPINPIAPGRIPSIPGIPGMPGGGGSNTIINTTSITRSTTAVQGLSRGLMGLAASAGGLYAAQKLIGYVADSAGKVQMATIAFKTLLGSADAAKDMVRDIQKFAVATPFNFSGALHSAQQLKAMGFSAKEIIPTMTTLGDAVAALGGDSDVFGRIAYNMGQIRTQGKATAIDIRQFQMAGMDIYAILKAATGQMYTLSDVTSMTADELIPKLITGMNKLYGGTMKNAMGTIPQSLSTMQDSFEQLAAAVGQKLTPVFVGFANGATAVANALKYVVQNSTAATYAMSAIAVGGAAFGVKRIWDAVAARRSLTRQVLEDIAAERTKSTVAGIEADAIGKGTSVVEKATKARFGFVGILKKAKDLLGTPISIGGKVFQNGTLGSSLFARGGARTLGLATYGGAAISAGMGAVGGIAARNNYRAAGYSNTTSNVAGVATGVGLAVAAQFVPGGKVAILIGEGIAWAVNKYYNKPLEKAAQGNMSDEEQKSVARMNAKEQANWYFKEADKMRRQGDIKSARMYFRTGKAQQRKAAAEAEAKRDAELRAKLEKEAEQKAEQKAFNDLLSKPSSAYGAGPAARKERNSDWIIRLPASPADKSHELRRYNRQTPMPSLAR